MKALAMVDKLAVDLEGLSASATKSEVTAMTLPSVIPTPIRACLRPVVGGPAHPRKL
jgi:hypothetical protein